MHLVIRDAAGAAQSRYDDLPDIAYELASLGMAQLRVGRIAIDPGHRGGRANVADAQALATLHRAFGIVSADRVGMMPGYNRWPTLRAHLRERHTHSEYEVRVFLRGRGLFDVVLPGGGRAQLLCEAGDWLALPPRIPHAFDPGHTPDFDALRLFASPEGWVATPTADAARAPLPDLDRLLAERRQLQEALA